MGRRFNDEISFYADGTAVPYGVDPDAAPDAEAAPAAPAAPTTAVQLGVATATPTKGTVFLGVPTATRSLDSPHGYQCGFHPHVSVSEQTPLVTCTRCGERLDPYEVLRQFMRHERQFAFQLSHLRDEKTRLTSEIEALKRERNNVRAQTRRARERFVATDDLDQRDEVERLRETIRRSTTRRSGKGVRGQ